MDIIIEKVNNMRVVRLKLEAPVFLPKNKLLRHCCDNKTPRSCLESLFMPYLLTCTPSHKIG